MLKHIAKWWKRRKLWEQYVLVVLLFIPTVAVLAIYSVGVLIWIIRGAIDEVACKVSKS